MSLKLVLPIKKVQINNKILSIPKLSIIHHEILNKVQTPDEHLKALLKSIDPKLSAGEGELALLHLLEFNGRIKSFEIDGKLISIDDIQIQEITEFQAQGQVYKFRPVRPFEQFGSVDEVLKKLFVSVNGEKVDTDFMAMPAFVYKWADTLTNYLILDTPRGQVKGFTNILRLFE